MRVPRRASTHSLPTPKMSRRGSRNTIDVRRPSCILPFAVESFERVADGEIGDFYLMVGELVRYSGPNSRCLHAMPRARSSSSSAAGRCWPSFARCRGADRGREILGPHRFERLPAAIRVPSPFLHPGELRINGRMATRRDACRA